MRFVYIVCALFGCAGNSAADGYNLARNFSEGTKRPTIVIFPIDAGSNDTASLAWRLLVQDLIKQQLYEFHGIYLSPDTDYALRALRLKSPIDKSQATLAAKFLNAGWVVWGTYRYDGGRWSVKLYLAKANNAGLDCVSARSEDLFDVRDQVTFSLLKKIGIPITETEKRNMLRRWTVSPPALRDFSLAELSTDQGRPLTNSEAYLRDAIRLDPQFSEAYRFLASVLYDEHESEAAIVATDRALELRPDYADAHELLAVILASENKFADSEKEFQIATRLDPDEAETFERLGELYMEEGLQSSAFKNFQKAVAIDPFFAIAHASLGAVYANDGDWKKAASELDAAARMAPPNDVNTEQQLCMFYGQIHQIKKAVVHGQEFLNLAKKWKEDPATIQFFQDCVSRWQSMLTPYYFTNPPPQQYSEATIQTMLRKTFDADQLSLIVNPLATSAGMRQWANELTAGATNNLEKARMLFEVLIQHRDELRWQPYTAEAVFSLWNTPGVSFHCQEYAYLYVALARCVGLQAYNVDVQETCLGEQACHACAAVFFGDKYILVDPAYCYFGAAHRKFTILDDLQSIGIYLSELGGLERCRMGFRLAPEVRLTQSRLFDALLATNNTREATQLLSEMTHEDANGWTTDSERALLAIHEGRYDDAIALAKLATDISPNSGFPHLILARGYFARMSFLEANREFRRALDCVLSDDQTALARGAISRIARNYYDLGSRKFDAGDLTGAWTNFNAAVEIEPGVAESYAARGCVEEAQSNFDSALSDFTKAIELKPNSAEIHFDRGCLEQRQNRLEDALADYNDAIKNNPNWAPAYIYRSSIEQANGNLSGAEYDRAKATKLGSDSGTNAAGELDILAWVRYKRQEFANSLSDFRRACVLNPSDRYARIGIWLCDSRLGRTVPATDELREYLAKSDVSNSNDWPGQVCRFLAGLMTEENFLAAAESPDIKRDQDQHCEAYFYIGSKRQIAGDKAGAIDCFKKCLDTGVQNFAEYQSAKAELRVLGRTN